VAAGGSFIGGRLDEHSDLDLVVISGPEVAGEVLRTGSEIAGTLGPLLAAFVGDHVGAPRLLICFSRRQPPRRRCPPAPARSENGLYVAFS
jgi:hypothetical protein